MNFRLKGRHSVILMSVRENSPYQDEITEDGTVLIYEGHDTPKTKDVTEPKRLDQPELRSSGTLLKTVNFIKRLKVIKKVLKDQI